MDIRQLIQNCGKPYSEELGISENIAKKTYREFEKRGITTPEKISAIDWHDLVAMLDAGGYARYDFKTFE